MRSVRAAGSPKFNKRQSRKRAFTMSYGLPERPITATSAIRLFQFRSGLDTNNGIEAVFSRGFWLAPTMRRVPTIEAIWGLYGSYEYVGRSLPCPSTAASLEPPTNVDIAPCRIAKFSFGCVGYAVRVCTDPRNHRRPLGDGQRDYHYGPHAQALINAPATAGIGVARHHRPRLLHQQSRGDLGTETEDIERIDRLRTIRVSIARITAAVQNRSGNAISHRCPLASKLNTVSIGYTRCQAA